MVPAPSGDYKDGKMSRNCCRSGEQDKPTQYTEDLGTLKRSTCTIHTKRQHLSERRWFKSKNEDQRELTLGDNDLCKRAGSGQRGNCAGDGQDWN